MLTRKQKSLLEFIDARVRQDGISPSFDEMKEALGLRSKSGVHRLISALEERGFIRRLPHRARAIEVIRLPPHAGEDSAEPSRPLPFRPSVIRGGGGATPMVGRSAPEATALPAEGTEAVSLPLYGRIAAGTPIEALRDTTSFADVPASLLGRGEHYVLEVDGDSMVEAGILDGDIVIVRRVDQAENGAIVVALVDGAEVTLKRLRQKGATIALEPANSAYETRIFGPDRVRIQGRLIGLMRRY